MSDFALRSVHVIAGLDPAHGGPSYTVPRLCQALVAAGVDAQLLSVAEANGCDIEPEGESVRCFPPDWASVPVVRQMRCSSGLRSALRELAPNVDVIHNHGLWLMPNVKAGRAALLARKPFIVAPRGMLSSTALSFSRLKKRVVWALLQGDVVRRASCIHATSEQEHNEIRDFGTHKSGGYYSQWNRYSRTGESLDGSDRCWSDCIITWADPSEKGIGAPSASLGESRSGASRWRLRIVGPDELGHARELAALAAELKTQRVSIEGPVAGAAKAEAYRDADLFVLPTLNENFANTVAEALAAGTPVIATKGAPWDGLERELRLVDRSWR